MENEWIQRAGPKQSDGRAARRYEDTLRDLRERYDEEVESAHTTFRKELQAIEERRTEALRELTETHRQLLELSPYRDERTRYEQMSSAELIPAVRSRQAIPARYHQAKNSLENTLLEAADAAGVAGERSSLEEVRSRFESALSAWRRAPSVPRRPPATSTSGARSTSRGSR
jgi:hypothetical protein